jgi:hypothetical protein
MSIVRGNGGRALSRLAWPPFRLPRLRGDRGGHGVGAGGLLRGYPRWQGGFLNFIGQGCTMKRSLRSFGLFFSAATAAGCWFYYESGPTPPPPVQCVYATDCLAGFGCQGGICVLSPPYGGTGGSDRPVDASSDGAPNDGAAEDGPMDASGSECSTDTSSSLQDGAVDSSCTAVADPSHEAQGSPGLTGRSARLDVR